jgi:opacity protein-like surface antigen
VRARLAAAVCVAGLLGAVGYFGPVSPTAAAERHVAGATYLGLGGAFSINHDAGDDLTGFQLLPHLGFVLTDTVGPSWLRGNLELLAEPALIHFSDDTYSSTVVGASALARWVFAGSRHVRPYVEVGVGALLGETALYQTDCEVNFLLQAGPGLLVSLTERTTLTVGYRFQHVSNGGVCHYNVGINSSAFYLGVSYELP